MEDQKIESPLSSPDHWPDIGKKGFLIAFRQILPKFLPATCIFSYEITTYLKSSLELNHQFPARLSSKIIHGIHLLTKMPPSFVLLPQPGVDCLPSFEPFLETLLMRRESHPAFKNLLISPTRKTPLNKFTFPAIKNVIPSQSNSNFNIITLYKF